MGLQIRIWSSAGKLLEIGCQTQALQRTLSFVFAIRQVTPPGRGDSSHTGSGLVGGPHHQAASRFARRRGHQRRRSEQGPLSCVNRCVTIRSFAAAIRRPKHGVRSGYGKSRAASSGQRGQVRGGTPTGGGDNYEAIACKALDDHAGSICSKSLIRPHMEMMACRARGGSASRCRQLNARQP
jgi:hypothetical protein